MTTTGNKLPEYWSSLYGDSTIDWVPPVTNYLYAENLSQRGINNTTFRWEEVRIDLLVVQTGAVLDFVMPDSYLLQITPDIGWHDTLAMLGESDDPSINNSHLKSLGPYSISNGTLQDNGDNSVQVSLTVADINRAIPDGYDKYLWRAVPWANGNPGLGGLPSSFKWISTVDQFEFSIDQIQKETKNPLQVISGTKSSRVTISVNSSNTPTVFIEQSDTVWKVVFNIDRPNIKFKIIATDDGGSAVATYPVDIKYAPSAQYSSHVWNPFDSFGLLAGISRLPEESNYLFRERITDAFARRGDSSYTGLVNSINRELGLSRKDTALTFSMIRNFGQPVEQSLSIFTSHTMMSISAASFIYYEELQKIDSYRNTLTTSSKIKEIISIKTLSNTVIPVSKYFIVNDSYNNKIHIDSVYSGLVKVTYRYLVDYIYNEYKTVGDIIFAVNNLKNINGDKVLIVTLDSTMSSSEFSKYIYKGGIELNKDNITGFIGWSRIGLFSISDEEFKQSFIDENSMYFNSEFYQYVLELKSKTNIEWGFVVCDKDYWDSIDAEWYGRDSLPLALDVKISKYITVVPISKHSEKFDAWEAFRMNYYFDNNLIKNIGFPQSSFKSGVGYKTDCAVFFFNNTVSSSQTRINFNPITTSSEDILDFSELPNSNIISI